MGIRHLPHRRPGEETAFAFAQCYLSLPRQHQERVEVGVCLD